MRSLLAGLGPADIRRDPFPHIVADNPMDPILYRALSESYPPFARIGWTCPPDQMPNNKRYEMPGQIIIDAPDMPSCWKEFVALHSEPDFLREVGALFEGHWPDAMLAALGGGLGGQPSERLCYSRAASHRLRQDARIEINTPVRDCPSSSRGVHLDTPNRLFSCLFYMRAADDESIGGDLALYRWKDRPLDAVDRYEVRQDAVELATVVPYAANRLVIFPQSVHALHGVTPRHPTPHLRRYVFITAELDQPWLTV